MANQDNLINTIGRKIRERRKIKGWSLEELSRETKMNKTTLSRLETGSLAYVPSDEILSRIAVALDTTIENIKEGTGIFQIGIGGCLWAAPLFVLMNSKTFSEKFNITYRRKKDEEDTLVFSGNDVEKDSDRANELLTAKELKNLLLDRKLDMIFIPGGAYDDIIQSVFRIGTIMNTVKGGLKILLVSRKQKKNADFITDFISHKKILLFHSESTIAEQVVNKTFLQNAKSQVEPHSIEINDLNNFKNIFLENVKTSRNNAFESIGYIGWEPHITFLKKHVQDLHFHVIDYSDIVDHSQAYQHITFDCVVSKEKLSFFQENKDFLDFLIDIDRAIVTLNDIKMYPKAHRIINDISDSLQMNPEDTLRELKIINHELSFSKEWVLYKQAN